MKLRAAFFSHLLMVVLACAVAEAGYIVDTPHNSDNNIKCGHCHSADALGNDLWFEPPPAYGEPGYDPDITRYNWVCERCHSATPTDPDPTHKAPVKQLHAASTIDPTASWSTECVDCHDPHFQRQLEWEATVGPPVYLATGVFLENLLPTDWNEFDIYDPNTAPFNLGGPQGTTTIRVDLTGYQNFDLDPTVDDWSRKGKSDPAYNARATDHSRGLILVTNTDKAMASRIFEIVKMTFVSGTAFDMTVNGNLTGLDLDKVTPIVVNSQPFGVIYGGLLRKRIKTPPVNEGDPKGVRDVKFFSPKSRDYLNNPRLGGPVDLTVSPTEPLAGLCQVCHATTSYYTESTAAGHHDADGTACGDCHDMVADGGAPQFDHTAIISAVALACPSCHLGYDTDPSAKHIGSVVNYTGCQTCHTNPDPLLDGIGAPNLRFPEVTQRTGTTNDGTTHGLNLLCTDCHNITYGTGNYTSGHPSAGSNTNIDNKHKAAIAPQLLCVEVCHGTLSMTSLGDVIVSNTDIPGGHSSNCTLCHLTVTPPPVVLTPNAEIAQTNLPSSTNCGGCHTASFDGHPNHDHSTTVLKNSGVSSNTVNCIGCHDAPAGNGPFVNGTEVHSGSGCLTCHSASNGAPIGSALTGWGGTWSATASGECITCHITHFDGHDHGVANVVDFGSAEHTVSFVAGTDKTQGGTACYMCHDDAGLGKGIGALGTWAAIMIEHQTINSIPGQNACEVCHNGSNVSGLANTPDPAVVSATIANGGAVTCTTCHIPKLGPHGSHPDTPPYDFVWTATTKTTCGTAGCHDWLSNENVVLKVHGNGTIDNSNTNSPACPLCHVDAANNNYARKSGTIDGLATQGTAGDRQRDCLVCHTGTLPFMHHVKNSTQLGFTVNNCATLCHKTGAYPADHLGNGTTTGMVMNHTGITNVQKACSTCHDGTFGTSGDGNNIPLDPTGTDPKVHDACTTCHYVNTSNSNMVELVAWPSANGYATAMPDNSTVGGTDGGGTCTACHTNYFEAHTHHSVGNQIVHNTSTDRSWDLPPRSCETCHHDYDNDNATSLGLIGFPQIAWEHDRVDIGTPPGNVSPKNGVGSCVNCHYNDSRPGINTVKYTGTTVADVVTEASANGWTVNCLDCHYAKNTPSVHGLTYINHLQTNLTGEEGVAGTYPPIAETASCDTCHPHGTDSGVPTPIGPDSIIVVHKNPSCDVCHTSQPNLKTSSPNLAQFADGNPFYCDECHQTNNDLGFTPPFHGMLSTDGQTRSRHNNLADSDPTFPANNTLYNCQVCHIEMYDIDPAINADKKIARHPTCETCHTADVDAGGNDAQAIIAAGSQSAQPPQTQPCEACHIDTDASPAGAYSMHSLAKADVITDDLHDGFDLVGGATNYAACKDCHTITSQANVITVHLDDCTMCHGADNNGTGDVTDINAVIRNFSSTGAGNGTAVDCEDCHNESNSNAGLLHGLAADAATAAIHDQIASDSPSADTTCSNCHDMTTTPLLKILTMHMSPINGDTVSRSCLVCHNPVGEGTVTDPATNALNAINTGKTAGGANPKTCISCHGTATYLMHSISFDATMATQHNNLNNSGGSPGTDADCSVCHTIGIDLAQLTLHTVTLVNPCSACHMAGAAALGNAPLTISDGWKTTGSTTALCEDCHAQKADYTMHGLLADTGVNGVVNEHQMYLANLAPASNCVACHLPNTATGRLTIHPANPTVCQSCHISFESQVKAAINSGVAGVTVRCETCHNGGGTNVLKDIASSWYNHADPNHTAGSSLSYMQALKDNTATGTPNIDNCVSCHNQATQVLVHDGVSQDGNPCDTCHAANGLLQGAATAYEKGVSGVVECIFCHTTYPEGHVHHTPSGANQVVYDVSIDRSQQLNDFSTGCAECHPVPGDNSLFGTAGSPNWTNILAEHNTQGDGGVGCNTCHNAALLADKSGLAGTPDDTLVNTVIGTDATATCTDCHTLKKYDDPASSHGGHDSSHFNWTTTGNNTAQTCGGSGGNLSCHAYVNVTTPDVATTVHTGDWAAGNGANATQTTSCENCHNQPANPLGGDNNTGPGPNSRGTAEVPPANATSHLEDCTVCHGVISTFFDGHSHDHSSTVIGPTGAPLISANCLTSGCHSGMTSPFMDAGGNPGHTGCDSCHNIATNGALVDGTVGIAASANNAGINPDSAWECGECHTAYFNGHATHTSATHAVLQQAGDLSDGALCNTCHGSFTNTWAGGIFALHQSSCTLCHDINSSAKVVMSGYADLQAAYQSDTGILACLNCHNDKSATHGGHPVGQFAWTGATQTSCGAPACHNYNYTGNDDVVLGVHNGSYAASQGGNVCVNCHNQPYSTGGGDNNTGPGLRGVGTAEITANGGPANATTHAEACTVCHTLSIGATHHTGTDATGGNCIACHEPDVGQFGVPAKDTRAELLMQPNLACNWCHLYAPNMAYQTDASSRVIIYGLSWNANEGQAQHNLPMLPNVALNHAVSTNATQPINDYAACFACHGANPAAGTVGIHPFHGLYGVNYANVYTSDNGGNPLDGNETINVFAGPTILSVGTVAHTVPRHFGFNALNWLQPWVSPNGANNTVGGIGNGGYYGGNSGYKKIFDADGKAAKLENPAAATYKTTFAIPWDSFTATTPAAPQNITYNSGGVNGNQTTPSTVPLVPLNLP
jgi:hypothetical protein